VMQPGNLRIIMNWNEEPSDLDIYSIQIDTYTKDTCTTNYNKKEDCPGVKLDLDNRDGGDKGPETITYEKMGSNPQYIYMIYVEDYSMEDSLGPRNNPPRTYDPTGQQFRDSQVRLTITDGVQTKKVDMKKAGYNKEQYWLAGCVRSDGDGFEWKEIETFETNSPEKDLRCMEVFGLTGTVGPVRDMYMGKYH